MTRRRLPSTDFSLNSKLIQAIEKQAELEDSIAAAREDLASAKKRIKELEDAQQEHARLISSGLLIQKEDVDQETDALMRKLMEESRQRTSAVESKKEIEKELEDLTRSLFEEANKLVVIERIENAKLRERNVKLTGQLADNETLLISHQAQLEELKGVMQKMTTQEGSDSRPNSPMVTARKKWSRDRDSLGRIINGTPVGSPLIQHELPAIEVDSASTIPESQNPEESAGLLMPRYRTDIASFHEFESLLPLSRQKRPDLSRQTSTTSLKHDDRSNSVPNRSESPVEKIASPHASPALTSIWQRYADSGRDISLRDTKFLKRAIVEDIEPTLRLDMAPDLGYLTRRAIQSAVLDGTLIVEPVPSHLARYAPERIPCSLCAESRYVPGKMERNFRLKTSEKTDTQTHMLCDWCVDRVRSVCTYVAFLKQVKDGLWRAEGEIEEMRVWEESVKLRECMFWARVGHVLD